MKAWWGLAASALSLLIIVLAYLAMVAGLPTAQRLSRDEAAPGIEVPVIGTVGDFPDPAHRHVVNVTADGRIVVEGRAYEEEAPLIAELSRRVAGLPDISLVLRVDGATPWRVAESLILSCRAARARRICVVVRSENDGQEGALGWLSTASDGGGMPLRLIAQQVVDVAPTTDDAALRGLFAELRRAWASAAKRSVLLRVDPRAPTRAALGVIDVALRAGAEDIETLDVRTAGLFGGNVETGNAPPSLRLNGRTIETSAASEPIPPVQRVHRAVDLPAFDFSVDDRSDEYPLPAGLAPK